jgi:superfamily II DNA or RNA helicase
MDTIKVHKKNHAFLHIDAEPSILNELTDFFCFYAEGYQFTPAYKNKMWDGKIRLFNSRDRELPGGLYKYLHEFAGVRDYNVEVGIDNYYGVPDGSMDVDLSYLEDYTFTSRGEPIEHRDYQLNAVHHGLSNKRALLISPTASGKSFIIYSLIRYYLENYNKKILIIVPTTSLVKQMYTDFADYSEHDDTFDAGNMVHCIYGGQPKIAKDERIVVSTWQSIYKLQTTWFEQYGMVIGDEAHNFKAKSLTTIMSKCKEAEYRFGTTGTLDGSQVHKLVLEGHFGPSYKVTTTKDLMDSGALSDLDINVLLLKYREDQCREVIKMDYQKEVDFIVTNEKRNKFIANLALDQEGNTLVLFNFVEKHGKPLHKLISDKAHRRRKVFFVSGATDVDTREEVRRITEKEKDAIIVASLGVFSTGVNIRNLHNVIFASPSKSQIKVLQSIGRTLRKSDDGKDATLFDIADDLHWKSKKNYTLNHAGERIKIYAKEKFKYNIYEVNLYND